MVRDINLFSEILKQIYMYTFKDTLETSFQREEEVDLRVHSEVMKFLFRDKNFYKFVESVITAEMKFEELASKRYISQNFRSLRLSDLGFAREKLIGHRHLFIGTVEHIKTIQRINNPWTKLLRIGLIRQYILDEMRQYMDGESCELEADDFLNIIVYCMVRTRRSYWMRNIKMV